MCGQCAVVFGGEPRPREGGGGVVCRGECSCVRW